MQFCPNPKTTKGILLRRRPAERVATARQFGDWPVRLWLDLRYTIDVMDGTIVTACMTDMTQPKDIIVVAGLEDGSEEVASSLATVRTIEHLHAQSPELIDVTFAPSYEGGTNGTFTWRGRPFTVKHKGYRRGDGFEVYDEGRSLITTYRTLADLRLSFGRS